MESPNLGVIVNTTSIFFSNICIHVTTNVYMCVRVFNLLYITNVARCHSFFSYYNQCTYTCVCTWSVFQAVLELNIEHLMTMIFTDLTEELNL